MDAHLVLLVDVYVEHHLVGTLHLALYNVDLGILVSLVIEVFLGQDLRTVYDVTRQTHAFHHTQLRLHILTFSFLDAVVVDGRDTGAQS